MSQDIQAQRQKLRNIASTQHPAKPRSRMYRLGTESVACSCVKEGAALVGCAECGSSGTVQKPVYVEVRQPSAAVVSHLLKVSNQSMTLIDTGLKDADGNPQRAVKVEGDTAVFNAHATFHCTFLPDTNIRVWDAQADLDRMLAEPHDQTPQAEIGPLVEAIMKEVRQRQGNA